MKKHLIFLVIVALPVLLQVGTLRAASPSQSTQSTNETYTWSAELVALDETARTITVKVKSWVDDKKDLEQLGTFKPADQIMLTWSGADKYASGIWHVARYDASKPANNFMLPVEFVSYDAKDQYITFKTRLPADGIAAVKSLKPGEWVTATSPHGPSSKTDAIVAIRPFVSSSTSSN